MLPQIHPTVFVASTATILGNVTIAAESSVWYGAVLRGDTDQIVVGRQTNLQDQVILHTDAGLVCEIGNRVTVGHAAIVHGAKVHDDCLVGIRSVILNGCEIGAGSIVGAGAVIPEGTVVPPGSVVMGVPGRIVRETEDADLERMRHGWQHYVQLARRPKQQPAD